MATPSPSAIAQGRMEAIEAVRKMITPCKGDNLLGLPTEVDGRLVELSLAPFQGDGEEERHVRGNELCRLLAKRPELVHSFNGLPADQQLLTLMLQEPAGAEGCAVKEWFLEASELQRHKVGQVILGQEGARDRFKYEGQLRHFEEFFLEREKYGAPERLKAGWFTEEDQKRRGLQSDLYT